jgi:hypothetical protein
MDLIKKRQDLENKLKMIKADLKELEKVLHGIRKKVNVHEILIH